MFFLKKNLFRNQPYTTNVSHLISINVSQSALSFHLHTLAVCVCPHTLLHTSSVPNHKFKQKTKNKRRSYLNVLLIYTYFFFFLNGRCWVGSQQEKFRSVLVFQQFLENRIASATSRPDPDGVSNLATAPPSHITRPRQSHRVLW